MGFLRRRVKDEASDAGVPAGPELPDDLAEAPADQQDWWATRLAQEAALRGGTDVPPFVAKATQVALVYVCGEEAASQLPQPTLYLGFNLALHGYWVRATEMDRLGVEDGSRMIGEVLRVAHDEELYGADWWATVAGFSYNLGDPGSESQGGMAQVRAQCPPGLGDDFRQRLAAASVELLLQAGATDDAPAAAEPLNGAQMTHCWSGGYWMRALVSSLPKDAVRELRKVR